MIDITSRRAKLMATMLLGAFAMPNIYAIQPWSDGVRPLLIRMEEIDQKLSLNFVESMSEFLTVKDIIRLAVKKDSLLLEKANLTKSLKMSAEVRDNGLVIYALPSDVRFNSALHTDVQARK